jgi:hypothetical protein
MGRDGAFKGLTIEQFDHPGIGIDRVGLGGAALLPLVVIDLIDHVQETARGIERHERRIGAIVASSGLRTVTAETEPFEVKSKPRTAAILRPKPGERFPRGASVVLIGGAHSPDFETADFEEVVWTSNLDGHVGIGHQLTTHTLSSGRHRITVSAPDGLGGEASASVTVQIQG